MKIQIPRINNKNFEIDLSEKQPCILVGANGSGKTRLSVYIANKIEKTYQEYNELKEDVKELETKLKGWENKNVDRDTQEQKYRIQNQIEDKKAKIGSLEKTINSFGKPTFEKVYRISAHRDLSLNTDKEIKNYQEAQKDLLDDNNQNYLENYRYRNDEDYISQIQNDFDKLIVALYSEEAEVSIEYTQNQRNNNKDIDIPESKLSKLISIWNKILPHRELSFNKLKIEVQNAGGSKDKYNPANMSDGERNIFYILGHCLLAPKNALLIIDEPELHINRSISNGFWSSIKGERSDCAFLFITHSIDFINANTDAQIYFIKAYQHEDKWDIDKIDNSNLEYVKFKVLGSRKDVIFVEGEYESLDYLLYSKVYKNYLIIPVGGCEKVKKYVKSFNENNQFHYIKAYGIIDKDYTDKKEKEENQNNNIFTLDVAEIENVLLLEVVARKISSLDLSIFPDNYKEQVFQFIEENKQNILERKIKYLLKIKMRDEINEISCEIKKYKGKIEDMELKKVVNCDVKNMYEKIFGKIFRRTSIHERIKLFLGKDTLVDSIKPYLPKINGSSS